MKKKIKILNYKFNNPITCLTAYSSPVAKILDGNVDMILIGDSLGTTLYGMKNTRGVDIEMMKRHGLAVTKYVKKSLTIIDMPYNTYSETKEAYNNAKALLKFTKANLLKLEINNNISVLEYLCKKKLNVVAHIGVTPQGYNDFSKIKVLGKTKIEEKKLIKLALDSEKVGAKIVLLECVTQSLAKKITSMLSIPTIGIGSSKFCDGQVLVFDDLIKIDINQSLPKFVKNYIDFGKQASGIVKRFNKDVKEKKYPSKKYTY